MSNLELLRSLVKPLDEKEVNAIEAYNREMTNDKIAFKEIKEGNEEWEKNARLVMARYEQSVGFDSSSEELMNSLINESRCKLFEAERVSRYRVLRDLISSTKELLPPTYYHRKELLACLDDDAKLEDIIKRDGNYFSISFQMLGDVSHRCFNSIELSRHYVPSMRYVPSTKSIYHGVECWPTKGGHAIKGTQLDIVKIGK